MKKSLIVEFICEERGASAIEYSVIAGIVSMGIVFALTRISSSLESSFSEIVAMFSSASH
jgi:Flp pilus assembly pilin Flp